MHSFNFALIGHPVKHSYSPWIHKRLLKQAELAGSYELKNIEPSRFNETIPEELNKKQWNGFNVTVPFKEAIIPFLDDIDERAERVGAVNTVKQENGRWIGYNTDGIGFVQALLETYPNILNNNMRVLLLGAGGASRAIYDALIAQGFSQIDIANRTVASAEKIADELETSKVETLCMSLAEAAGKMNVYDLIIQTTSVGMKPESDASIVRLDHIKPSAVVSDIVYQPFNTAFLADAKRHGAYIHFGYLMLLHQAKQAFKVWTGYDIRVDDIAKEIRLQLEGESKC